MARPAKKNIEYFPHSVTHGKTLFILKSRWGNDGYAFWFQLLELVGSKDGLFYDCNNPADWQFLLAKTMVSADVAEEILQYLCDLEAIDRDLWAQKVVFSQNLVDGVTDAFSRRKEFLPTKTRVIACINPVQGEFMQTSIGKGKGKEKEKEKEPPISPLEKTEEKIPYQKIIDHLNTKAKRRFKVTDSVRENIRGRWDEGHRLDSFVAAIDNQVREWGRDSRMAQYLRPETLFRRSKFDGYVNNVQIATGDVLDEAFEYGMGEKISRVDVSDMEAIDVTPHPCDVFEEP